LPSLTRTGVLIKPASQRHCTCVLIICMSLGTHGPRPRSDRTSARRQNGSSLAQATIRVMAVQGRTWPWRPVVWPFHDATTTRRRRDQCEPRSHPGAASARPEPPQLARSRHPRSAGAGHPSVAGAWPPADAGARRPAAAGVGPLGAARARRARSARVQLPRSLVGPDHGERPAANGAATPRTGTAWAP